MNTPNASLNAVPILLNMSPSPVKKFLNPSNKCSLPPKSTHSCNTLFLASDDLLIISLKTLFIGVQKAFASSKSPINISQVCAQPEPTDSFKESIIPEKVLTS